MIKIGHIVIDYYAEMKISEAFYHILNENNINWYPVFGDRANDGWVWFSNPKEYRKAKKLYKKEK